VDAVAISAIAESRLRTMPGAKFDAIVQAVTGGLVQTSAPLYAKALVGLGQLVGTAVLGRTGHDVEPHSVWLFGEELWVGFGKVGVQSADKVSADTVREAGSHINYAAASAVLPPRPARSRSSSARSRTCTALPSLWPTTGCTYYRRR
jgi:hypothetical protein